MAVLPVVVQVVPPFIDSSQLKTVPICPDKPIKPAFDVEQYEVEPVVVPPTDCPLKPKLKRQMLIILQR